MGSEDYTNDKSDRNERRRDLIKDSKEAYIMPIFSDDIMFICIDYIDRLEFNIYV